MQLDLNEQEVAELEHLFEETLSDLRMEISHTDRQDFRDGLKGRKEILMGLLERMKAGTA